MTLIKTILPLSNKFPIFTIVQTHIYSFEFQI